MKITVARLEQLLIALCLGCSSGGGDSGGDNKPPDDDGDQLPPCVDQDVFIFNTGELPVLEVHWRHPGSPSRYPTENYSCEEVAGCYTKDWSYGLPPKTLALIGTIDLGEMLFYVEYDDGCRTTPVDSRCIESSNRDVVTCRNYYSQCLVLPDIKLVRHYPGTTAYWEVRVENHTNSDWWNLYWRRHDPDNVSCWTKTPYLSYGDTREIYYQGDGFYDLAFQVKDESDDQRGRIVLVSALPVPGTYITENGYTIIDIGPDENEVLIDDVTVCGE